MPEKMLCPRRAEVGVAANFLRGADQDDYDREDDSCNYCGSLNPDTFMKRLEAGDVKLTPTDKNYKVYVANDGGEAFKQHFRDCYSQGAKDCKYDECTHWVTRDVATTKFYFQHLSDDQKKRFVELINQKKIKLEHPGYFYRMPFFCTTGQVASDKVQ